MCQNSKLLFYLIIMNQMRFMYTFLNSSNEASTIIDENWQLTWCANYSKLFTNRTTVLHYWIPASVVHRLADGHQWWPYFQASNFQYQIMKGLSSKPSGDYIVAPIFCLLS